MNTFSQTNTTDTVLHSPKKAAIYSAILPSSGQFYNKKYWKMPIVIVGMGTPIYFAIDNQKEFNRYKNAYKLRLEGKEDEFFGKYNEQALINEMDRWRSYRDYCIIGAALVYILQIVDANVDAHLFDFDIDDNLTLKMMPYQFNTNTVLTFGLTFRF